MPNQQPSCQKSNLEILSHADSEIVDGRHFPLIMLAFWAGRRALPTRAPGMHVIAKKTFTRTRPGKMADFKSLEETVWRLTSMVKELTDDNRRLTVDLSMACDKIVELMDIRGLLDGHAGLEDHDDLLEWRKKSIQRVLDAADVRDGAAMGDLGGNDRALCPLCRRSANGPGRARGFAFPEGLRRHLLGEHNSAQCDVFGAADKSIIRRIRAKYVRRHGR